VNEGGSYLESKEPTSNESISEHKDVGIDNTIEDGNGMNGWTGAIIGVFFTGVVTYIIEEIKRKRRRKEQEGHAASILFYDLKSIEYYLKEERDSVNLRYSDDWQGIVA